MARCIVDITGLVGSGYLIGDYMRVDFITATNNDDPRFLALVNRIVSSSVHQSRPADVFVVRIDHWFDHKWLAFAGKLHGAVAIHKPQRLTIPPFHPDRVVSEQVFTRDGESYRANQGPYLHRIQQSGENLSRFIGHVSKSGFFVWFSGDTAHSEQGSILMYAIEGDMQHGWYASFRRGTDWRLHKVKGLSRPELMKMMEGEKN